MVAMSGMWVINCGDGGVGVWVVVVQGFMVCVDGGLAVAVVVCGGGGIVRVSAVVFVMGGGAVVCRRWRRGVVDAVWEFVGVGVWVVDVMMMWVLCGHGGWY
jgi:hypothetical protein